MNNYEIIEKIKSGTVFYNPNIKTNLVFQVTEWSGDIKDTAKVNCIDKVTDYIHTENWNDMNITVNALLTGEYKFIESVHLPIVFGVTNGNKIMTKLISYIVTVGGDAGWRFSNGPQWKSIAGMLLFDADIWSMESIAESIHNLWKSYWNDRRTLCTSKFSEVYDVGFKYIKKFVENNDGVYVNAVFKGIYIPWDRSKSGYTQFGEISEDRRIDPSTYEVIQWELNGKSENNNYDK